METKERFVLRFIQISDLHITKHRNLLEPMVDPINQEAVDLVIATGDIAHTPDKETIDLATKTINKIRHKVVVLPGDYDGSDHWSDNFGDRYKTLNLGGYHLEFLDTSFMRHRFAVGWADVMAAEDPQQYQWLKARMKGEGYHIMFSHHPFWSRPVENKHELLRDNLRAIYSGHLHETAKFYFKYSKPMRHFGHGFSAVPMKFHGNSCYAVVLVKDNDEIINVPKMVGAKRTAW